MTTEPFVKLYIAIVDHPKFVGLSDAAWTLWMHGLVYAGRSQSDGLIPTGMLNRLCNTRNPTKAAAELVTAGAWEIDVDGWVIHDYLGWQTSAAEIEQKSAKASKGASLTNHQRWHVERNRVEPQCRWCDGDSDRYSDSEPVADSDDTAIAIGSLSGRRSKKEEVRSKKEPKVVPTTLTNSDERPGGGTDQSTEAKITAALTAAADHEATVSELTGADIGNSGGYRHRIAERLRTERGEQLRSMAEDPDTTVADLTEFLTRPVPLNSLDDLVPGVGA